MQKPEPIGRSRVRRFFLLPGSLVCDIVGLTAQSANRQILRMSFNTLIWGAVGVVAILRFAL
jgi:hypothetical protein